MLNQNTPNPVDNRRMMLALGLTALVFLTWNFFFGPDLSDVPQEPAVSEQAAQMPATPSAVSIEGAPVPGARITYGEGEGRALALSSGSRVGIEDTAMAGSINLQGGVLDDIVLHRFKQELEPGSPDVELLQPSNLDKAYFVEMGWIGAQQKGPGLDAVWQADGSELTRSTPITLSLEQDGLLFERRFEILDDYLVQVTQSVTNMGAAAASMAPFIRATRYGQVQTSRNWLIHEGVIGNADKSLQQVDYADLEGLNPEGAKTLNSEGGWLGFTDKYWLTAVMPKDQQTQVSARALGRINNNQQEYFAGFAYPNYTIEPGQSTSVQSLVFTGSKEVGRLDEYGRRYGLRSFDMAIDYGWFYYLTKPYAKALIMLKGLTGNFGWAIILLTIAVKLLFFPLAFRSYMSMAAMRRLAPRIQELREQYGDDRQKISQETMALYKKEGANPVSGCLPMLLQIPVFFALYKTLFVTIEMRHAPFVGWIQDLSAPDPTSILNLFGLLPYSVPELGLLSIFSIGLWPLLMGITMFVQQKLNPPPADPQQAMIFNFLPIVFTFMLATFPAGLVIYWTANNILTAMQQFVIMRYADSKKAAERAARRRGGSGAAEHQAAVEAESVSTDELHNAVEAVEELVHEAADAVHTATHPQQATTSSQRSAASPKQRRAVKGKKRR